GTSVNDRDLRSVQLNQAIIHSHTYQRGQNMFYRAHFGAVILQGGSPGSVGNEVAICLDNGPAGEVNTLKLKAKTRIRRTKGHIHIDPGMKAGSRNTDFLT